MFVRLFHLNSPEGEPIACADFSGNNQFRLSVRSSDPSPSFSVVIRWSAERRERLTLDGVLRGWRGATREIRATVHGNIELVLQPPEAPIHPSLQHIRCLCSNSLLERGFL